jgi:4a-hydroxytetrahydrobiopterin dehydratase
MRPVLLASAEIASRLAELPGWEWRDGALCRAFRFSDFSSAFAFMTRAALRAEQLDHHPDWSNIYNRVSVALRTHDAGGVTELDFQLAAAMSSFAP